LDLIVLVTSIINILTPGSDNPVLKSIRILRAFRPLRVISRSRNMRLVINALFRTLLDIGNLISIVSIIIIVFGLMGINLFSGKFFHCNGLENEVL